MSSLSLASSLGAVRAAMRVDKATSELLVGPDWAMNMDICDFCDSNTWQAKDVVKEIRRRLHHKNSKIQLLTLTLLETMVKNCGEYIHKHIADRKVLDEMIKIVKKRTDIHVRYKILVLLNSWQEAFGGPGGRYSQYYWACDELKRCGIKFPECPNPSVPIITPPATQPPRAQLGDDTPATSSARLDEGTSSEAEGLSDSILGSMRNVVELLDDMLQVANPNDRNAARDEVIVDLAERCRSNQKKLTQILTSTTEEELLGRALEMNEWLQSVLAMYDAIASGVPIPTPIPKHSKILSIRDGESVKSKLKIGEDRSEKNCAQNGNGKSSSKYQGEEKEGVSHSVPSRDTKASPEPWQSAASEDGASSSGSTCNALVVIDDPTPAPASASSSSATDIVTTSSAKEQDLIDLLSLVLTTSEETTQVPESSPAEPTFEANFSTYVVPWAQLQPQQCPNQIQTHYPSIQSYQGYSQYPSHYNNYNNYQPQGSNVYAYPTTPGHRNGSPVIPMQDIWQSQLYNGNSFQNQQYATHLTSDSSSSTQGFRSFQSVNSFQNPPPSPIQGVQSLQQLNSFSEGTHDVSSTDSSIVPEEQKAYIPTYKLFEDLNVLGSSQGKLKTGPYSGASGNFSHNIFTGRR